MHRLGDQHLTPFLLAYMQQLPSQTDDATGSDGARVSKQHFVRSLLHSMSHPRVGASSLSLCGQLSALARLPPSRALRREEDVNLLWTLMSRRIAEASSRLRLELTVYLLQVLCRHVDFTESAGPSFALVTKLVAAMPTQWMRPTCASFRLLQRAFATDSWLASHLPAVIEDHFDRILRSEEETGGEEETGSEDERQR